MVVDGSPGTSGGDGDDMDMDVEDIESGGDSDNGVADDDADLTMQEPGFPRACLLTTCCLKQPKLFNNNEELKKHIQRCMQQADKSVAFALGNGSASSGGGGGGEGGNSPWLPALKQSKRSTTVPLRVSLDYETDAPESSHASTASSSTDNVSNSSRSGSGSGSVCGSGGGSSGSCSVKASRGNTLSWRSAGTDLSISTTSAASVTPAAAAADNGRLKWSASLSVDGIHGTPSRPVRRSRALPAAAPLLRAKARPSNTGKKSPRRMPPPVSSRNITSGGSGGNSGRRNASSTTSTNSGSVSGGRGAGRCSANSTDIEGSGPSTGSAATTSATAATSAAAAAAAGDGNAAALAKSWKGSLGSWGASGGFTCPVNPLVAWGIPGCGKESRARDSKCDSCGRVLRVDWLVGASASVGSGVENPQLKLAGVVTFQNKSGITYQGRVVAINPTPLPGAPRGVVRVKYDDWPYDKYDEDANMEMVTPFGWIPTPVGRAGRRASKRPVTFTPSTESQYQRKPLPPPVKVIDLASDLGTEGESGVSVGMGGKGGAKTEIEEQEEEDEEESSSEEEVDEEEKVAPVKIRYCKHIKRGLAEPVNKAGECHICRNARLKTEAGITMCRHVREGEAKAFGSRSSKARWPADYAKGHCRECTLRKYPPKKVKLPRARLWPSCAMPKCRRRHHAWGMCAPCLATYKEKHPKSVPQHHGRRKAGKSTYRYTGPDAELTDSSDDDEPAGGGSSRGKTKVKKEWAGEDGAESDDTAAVAREAAAVAAKASGPCGGAAATRPGIKVLSAAEGGGGSAGDCDDGRRGGCMGKRAGGDTSRQAKRARVVDIVKDDPTCFYCQRAAGKNAEDELLFCADFDCNRSVHMKCCDPPFDKVPQRFYCHLCVEAGKDKACEDPCLACGSNDRDDLILVCDRDKCYSYFHCYCLPQPLEEPPEGEYVCPQCIGEELERGLLIAKRGGGTRPAWSAPSNEGEVELDENGHGSKKRRCSWCDKSCAYKTMWTCASGKELCKGKMFHRACLARGKGAVSTAETAAATTRRAAATNGDIADLWGVAAGGVGGVGVAVARGGGAPRGHAEVMEVRDVDNCRLCCPECGFDLLKMNVVDVLTQEQTYEGTAEQELAYKTFEKALKTSLEDPRFGIGKTREEFEEPFKGSIGSGANRTAMYGSVFEAAVDQMFRQSGLTSQHKFLDIGCGIGSIVLQAAAWAGCQAAGVEIVDDRFEGAVKLHSAFQKAVFAEQEFAALMHPKVIQQKVHLFKGCFLAQWENPEVRDADFIFFNNSSGWFNNSKALNNPDEHSLESKLLDRLKDNPSNNGKVLITLEHIAEWQPDCWERRSYKYQNSTRRAATYAAKELEFWEYTVVSQWECPGCTSLNTDAVNDCIVCGTYCRGKRNSKRL